MVFKMLKSTKRSIGLVAALGLGVVGSANAVEIQKELLIKYQNKNIVECVAKFSFCQTSEIIKRADVLLCCDGGLMHASNSVGTAIIPLFARLTPAMQLTQAVEAYTLFDKDDVNNIGYESVVNEYKEYLKKSKQ